MKMSSSSYGSTIPELSLIRKQSIELAKMQLPELLEPSEPMSIDPQEDYFHTLVLPQEPTESQPLLSESQPPLTTSRSHRPMTFLMKRRIKQLGLMTLRPLNFVPAVMLGLVLNLLDAVSYGMIIFPLGNPIFRDFGPDGISMFLLSTVISQVVYAIYSVFAGGNGNMMIEVMPFLHLMYLVYTDSSAEIITKEVGAENPKEVVATTMVAYALSTVATGLAFLILGYLKVYFMFNGSWVRWWGISRDIFWWDALVVYILISGGVGYFLLQTAIQVVAHIELSLDHRTLRHLFDPAIFKLWATSLLLALILRTVQLKVKHALLVPGFFLLVPVAFYAVAAFLGVSLEQLREGGWLFEMPHADKPFYDFYNQFSIVFC